MQECGVGVFIATHTKSALKKALKKRYIKVNGLVASTDTFIRGGETISIPISEEISLIDELPEKFTKLFEVK